MLTNKQIASTNPPEQSATDLEDSVNSLVPVFGNRLRSKIEMFNKTFSGLPMTTEQCEKFTRSELFFAEGNDAFERNDLLGARNQFDSARKYIDTVSFVIQNNMAAYFERFPEWNVWTEQTIRWSKQHCQTAIIVDKMAHSLSLFYNGKEGIRIPVEFGPNWIGVKAHRGDRATPEGQYFIRREIAFSTFGKALEIDYPNADDRKSAVNAEGPARMDIPNTPREVPDYRQSRISRLEQAGLGVCRRQSPLGFPDSKYPSRFLPGYR